MAIPKVMGIETEYGITVKNQPDFNPILSSLLLINSYETFRSSRVRWDYEAESPLRDARGFEYMEEKEGTSKEESRLINLILSNGARFYVDHAHPEYSSPETTNPRDLVIWDRAGERILNLSRQRAEAVSPPEQRILIYKNNTDSKGNSYGTHENYLMDRRVPFARIVQHMMPFFVSRQIFTGAGKVGLEAQWDDRGRHVFQLTQRADFFETEVGLETTLKRPIINTRDEPHADPEKYRRLHVIVGDANLCEVATFLKVGTTAIVLKMIEDGFLPDFSLVNPVAAIHEVSRDVSLSAQVALTDGRRMTALQLQSEYLEVARKYVDREDDTAENREVLERWETVLDALGSQPRSLSAQLDWVAKLRLLDGYRERDGLSWSDPKLRAIDLQYHDVRRERGLYHRLERAGKIERLTTDDEIERAVMEPPDDTRAFFRGRCIAKFPDAIAAASWDSVIMDTGRDALQRIPMREPLRGTRAHVQELLDACEDAAALVDRLTD
jgi:Pup amidohydrolase